MKWAAVARVAVVARLQGHRCYSGWDNEDSYTFCCSCSSTKVQFNYLHPSDGLCSISIDEADTDQEEVRLYLMYMWSQKMSCNHWPSVSE